MINPVLVIVELIIVVSIVVIAWDKGRSWWKWALYAALSPLMVGCVLGIFIGLTADSLMEIELFAYNLENGIFGKYFGMISLSIPAIHVVSLKEKV